MMPLPGRSSLFCHIPDLPNWFCPWVTTDSKLPNLAHAHPYFKFSLHVICLPRRKPHVISLFFSYWHAYNTKGSSDRTVVPCAERGHQFLPNFLFITIYPSFQAAYKSTLYEVQQKLLPQQNACSICPCRIADSLFTLHGVPEIPLASSKNSLGAPGATAGGGATAGRGSSKVPLCKVHRWLDAWNCVSGMAA